MLRMPRDPGVGLLKDQEPMDKTNHFHSDNVVTSSQPYSTPIPFSLFQPYSCRFVINLYILILCWPYFLHLPLGFPSLVGFWERCHQAPAHHPRGLQPDWVCCCHQKYLSSCDLRMWKVLQMSECFYQGLFPNHPPINGLILAAGYPAKKTETFCAFWATSASQNWCHHGSRPSSDLEQPATGAIPLYVLELRTGGIAQSKLMFQ